MEQATGVAAAKLRASRATCALYVDRSSTDLTVKEICSRIDVSERTFYRYFPSKADVVGPFFAWIVDEFLRVLATAPAQTPLREVLTSAHDASLGGAIAPMTRALIPLIFADDEFWSVYLRSTHDAEIELVQHLASRVSRDPRSPECLAAAAAIASSTRIALETMVRDGTPPAQTLDSMLTAFDGVLSRVADPEVTATTPQRPDDEESTT